MQSKKGLRINFETLKIVIEHHWTRKLIRTFKKGINWLKMFVCHFNWCLKRTCYVQNSRTPSLFYLNSSNQSKLKSKEMLCWGAFTCYAHISICIMYSSIVQNILAHNPNTHVKHLNKNNNSSSSTNAATQRKQIHLRIHLYVRLACDMY